MKPNKKTDRTVITLLILCLTFGVLFFAFSMLLGSRDSGTSAPKPDVPDTPDMPDTPDGDGDVDPISYPDDGKGDRFRFELLEDESGYRVIGIGAYRNSDLIIPAQYQGKPVKEIAAFTFSKQNIYERDYMYDVPVPAITSVTLPPDVTVIGECAFAGWDSLTKVTLYEGLTHIDNHAFEDCTSLESIVIPKSVAVLGKDIFKNCVSLKQIYCEIDVQPSSWSSEWLGSCQANVKFGYTVNE